MSMDIAEQTILQLFQEGRLYVTPDTFEVVLPLDIDFDIPEQTDWVNDENIVSWEVPRA